jgi:uncharacterized protein YgbK (DUF1537 family)
MTESHLPTLLMRQAGREVGELGLETVRRGANALAEALAACPAPIVVVDALTDDDLAHIAGALARLGEGYLPCGSAGLAEAWADALGLRRDVPPSRPAPTVAPLLLVSGSRNDATAAQIRRAQAELDLASVELDPYAAYDEARETARLATVAALAMRQGRSVLLTSTFAPLLAGGGDLVARLLAGAAAQVAGTSSLGGLFLTGGDVAVAVCRALGVDALRIAAEVQPGIPGGQLISGPCAGLWVVTKAGGFGDEAALVDAVRYLRGTSSDTASAR